MTRIDETKEFVGKKSELERRRERAGARIISIGTMYVSLSDDALLYVDASGMIYRRNPETGKFTLVVGSCVPKAVTTDEKTRK